MKDIIDNIIIALFALLMCILALFSFCSHETYYTTLNSKEIEYRTKNLEYEIQIRHLEYEILMLELDKEFNNNLLDTLLKIKNKTK